MATFQPILTMWRATDHFKKNSPNHWSPPPSSTFKLKFDGGSKGNLGPTRFGGAIRIYQGQIQGIFWGSLGFSSNNTVELD